MNGGFDAPSVDDPTRAEPSTSPVENIGPYRLLQRVGEGGMGEVWLAEQMRPVRRQVALKVIKAGMDTARVVARFEAERQALALMSHPSIAQVFDAGVTPQGRPFFAMEYVRGEAITTYANRHRLSIRQRIDLFLEVCDAVQHAHQKGVIHRDLKPSNILVTVRDDRPVPKVIDFGVAKATTHPLTDRTLYTELGALIGTPEYMSPEQAEMSGLDVDTRTDVYALGVILYELLTGVLPFDSRTLREKPLDDIRKTIREVDPPRPSTRVVMTAGVRAADARPEVVCASAGELRGDLDWITMRALEKDRTRRYGSASDLAADLRRHLDNLPVLASPPGRLYRVRKFVRRHRAGVATAAAGLALLITFSALVTIQARRIAVERDRANLEAETSRQVSDFLVGLFKVVDPRQAKGEAVTAREILDKGAESIKAALGSQPETQARLMATLGTVYGSIGLYEQAERLLREALQIQERDLGDAHASTLSTKRELALTLSMAGRSAEADRLAIDAVKGLERSAGPDHIETLMAKRVLFAVRQRQGRAKEAEALSMELLQAQRRVLGADHPETLRHLSDIANMYYDLKRYEESATLASEVLDTRRRLFGDSHPDTLTSSNNLAVAYQHLGRYAEAQPLMERTIAGAERVLGPKHPTYGIYVHSLGELMLAKGDLASAERHLRRALVIYELQTGHEFLGLVLYELAQVCAKQNKTDQALSFLERAVSEGYQHNGKRLGFVDDPALVALRGDARFQKAVADANRRPPR